MFISRFNRKNTFCSYRRNSPCVGLGDAVEANKRIVHLGAFPTHRMLMTACPTKLWDGQKLHKNRIVRVRINVWRLRTVSSPVQKEYLKKYGLIYYSDQVQPNNKSKIFFFLIAGSIIGPAMAGPTGPLATALFVDTIPRYDTDYP